MKTKTLTAKLKVPFVEAFNHYDDIFDRGDNLRKFFNGNIKAAEVAFCLSNGCYFGLFYYDTEKPNKKEIKELLNKTGFVFEKEDIY